MQKQMILCGLCALCVEAFRLWIFPWISGSEAELQTQLERPPLPVKLAGIQEIRCGDVCIGGALGIRADLHRSPETESILRRPR